MSMSHNYSESQRLEALESSVTGIERQMNELIGMMRQYTSRTGSAGQNEKESGDTGRGVVFKQPSSDTGKVPLPAVTSYCVTAVEAGRKSGGTGRGVACNHSSGTGSVPLSAATRYCVTADGAGRNSGGTGSEDIHECRGCSTSTRFDGRAMGSVEEKSEGNGASLLKEWSQVRDQLREEREVFRAERRQAAADLERLRAETENLRASMERLQRRVERQSRFVGGLEERLPARRAAGICFVQAAFQSPQMTASSDIGTASIPRIHRGRSSVSGDSGTTSTRRIDRGRSSASSDKSTASTSVIDHERRHCHRRSPRLAAGAARGGAGTRLPSRNGDRRKP